MEIFKDNRIEEYFKDISNHSRTVFVMRDGFVRGKIYKENNNWVINQGVIGVLNSPKYTVISLIKDFMRTGNTFHLKN